MLISTKIFKKYNPHDDSYEDSEWVLVDVPLMEICKILAKRFKITAQQMYDIVTEFDVDFDGYLDEDLEIQNLARTYYNPEECD